MSISKSVLGCVIPWFYAAIVAGSASAQTLFVPSGSSGIGTSSNDNVGIGTINPAASLDVDGSLLVTGGDIAAGTYGVKALGAPSADRDIFLAGAVGFSNGFTVQKIGAEMRYAFIDGNVGIGTTSPSHKLSVNGTIRAKEIIVDTEWADYVFADNYRLAPLAEVEAHIKEHRHLPGIPSATEVAAQGVSLGDMQSRILAKVEELTLHLIELKKENAVLRERVQTLEATRDP